MITYDDFAKLELKVATILNAERVEGSEKLLKLKVTLGDPLGTGVSEERQIIAGIGKSYEPEVLVGKQIIIIANLEPRSLMGLESQGMLLAADSSEGPVILTPSSEVAPGAKIK
jgi:methionine--tRNA ligase beta chain